MSAAELQTPILEGGIRSVNFFNGRLLTARDLSREQDANNEGHRRLGRAVGAGVAYGLEVSKPPNSTPASPVITIEPGLAVNRKGQTVSLPSRTDVSLVRQLNVTNNGTQIFVTCQPLQAGSYVAGAGVYLLTIAPAEATEGRALNSGVSSTSAACATDAIVDGVQFRLVQLSVSAAELSDPAHLRNRVAYQCFGVADPRRRTFEHDPFGPPLERYGLIDDLRDTCLTDCDVPLAVINWTATGGVVFIDLWAGRRPLTEPSAAGRWSPLVNCRRASEAKAMFLQFAEQLREIREREPNLDTIVASDRFEFLPPVGLLPLANVGSAPGFTYQKFFDQQAYHPPIYLEGAMVNPLIEMSLNYAPLSLVNKDPIKLFNVVEGATLRPYVLFISAYVPFQAEARFDITRWNFSNFA
jgi:hypothetical protein